MRRLFFVTHANVVIDADVPVPEWPLSEVGQQRHKAFSARLPKLGSIYSSDERKARDGADILATDTGLIPRIHLGLHENDRSATGFLPGSEFETVADAFFANPTTSIRGWERAIDAQARVLSALGEVVADAPDGDIAVIAHGGVGALTRAHVIGQDISRRHDQPPGGGGYVMVISVPEWTLIQDWSLIDTFEMSGASS